MVLNQSVLSKPTSDKLPFIQADLNYLVPMAERPVNYTFDPPPGIPRHNGVYKSYKLPIQNARSLASKLSLDREGFALIEHHSLVQDFYNEYEVQHIYYLEAEQLLQQITGAIKVVVFDHNVRDLTRSQQGENNAKEPVKRVHNDFTAKSGYSRALAELKARGIDKIDELLQHRFAIVNVWRSIAESVEESPLAVCDAQTIAPTDLVASDLVYRDRVGETYAITYNPAHRWFYFPQMQRHEALLIKCFDSAETDLARFTAHTAFDDPTSSPDARHRESIELRTLVFYPELA